MNKFHYIKCDYTWFADIFSGNKRFELRKNDRNYQFGDYLIIQETNGDERTGVELLALITFTMTGFDGLREGYILLGIEIVAELKHPPSKEVTDGTKAP